MIEILQSQDPNIDVREVLALTGRSDGCQWMDPEPNCRVKTKNYVRSKTRISGKQMTLFGEVNFLDLWRSWTQKTPLLGLHQGSFAFGKYI